MNLKNVLYFLLIVFLGSSCVTKALWDHTNPKEYVEIGFDEITEKELIDRGVRYERHDVRDVFYVEKSSLQKLGDYTIRAIGTPFTIVLDATGTVLMIIGAGFYNSALQEGKRRGCDQNDRCRKSGTFPPY